MAVRPVTEFGATPPDPTRIDVVRRAPLTPCTTMRHQLCSLGTQVITAAGSRESLSAATVVVVVVVSPAQSFARIWDICTDAIE